MPPKKQVVQADDMSQMMMDDWGGPQTVMPPMDMPVVEPPTKVPRLVEPLPRHTEPPPMPEPETDAEEDKRPKLKAQCEVDMASATLNVLPTHGGRALMALTDAGMHHLLAGARANVGIKAGRYFYEARITQLLNHVQVGRYPANMPKQHVRLGFSVPDSSPFIGETEDSICFDMEGGIFHDKQKALVSPKFVRDQIVGVLLNLDQNSANANTVSLFLDGKRVAEPHSLPESLKGKVLCPHVCYRNVTLQVHYGPQPMAPLPFKCTMFQMAAQEDCVVTPAMQPKDGKWEVVLPVGMPDEGTFSWLEGFLQKNPQYTELSDRKIYEWAIKSGLWQPRLPRFTNSNDKPGCLFGVQQLDELSVRSIINAVAPLVPRNYVVMEVKSNLIKAERKEILNRFAAYRKIAHVNMGDPPASHKAEVHASLLKEKQDKLDQEWKAVQQQKERNKAIAERQKKMMEARKAAEDAKKKQQADMMAAQQEGADAEMKEEGEDGEKAKEEEAPEEKKEESKEEATAMDVEVKKEEGDDEAKKEEEEDTEPPKAELTEEEKKTCFKSTGLPDIVTSTLNTSFAHFTVPEKQEGFDKVNFNWDNEKKCKEYLRSYILEKKRTTRVEDIQPSEWFHSRHTEWQKNLSQWQQKQKEWKQDPVQKEKREKAEEKKRRKEEKEQKAAEKAKAADGDGQPGEEKAEGETPEADKPTEDKAADGKEEEQAEDSADEEEVKEVDIDEVTDVLDVGGGQPLFANFAFEDWALMSLRFELHLLVGAFKQDVPDPDRPGMHVDHFPFYYNKYYRKQLNTRFFGQETNAALIDMVKDTVTINKDNSMIFSQFSEEEVPGQNFVKLTERTRRERQRRIDAGDEGARLKFCVVPPAGPQTVNPPPRGVVPEQNWAPKYGGGGGGWNSRPQWGKQQSWSPKGKGGWSQQTYAPKQQGWR